MPIGRFRRGWWYPDSGNIMKEIEAERLRWGENWPPLKSGMCGGSAEGFLQLKQRLDEDIRRMGRV